MRILKIVIFLTVCFSSLFGQEESVPVNTKELTIRIGFSNSTVKDKRMSAIGYSSWSPKYDLAYTKINDKRISEIRFQFSYMKSRNGGLLGLNSIRPNVNYSYQRKIKEGIWLGGFLENNTLLNFPSTRTGHFNNNPISYTISQSIGPRITYMKNWKPNEKNRFEMRTSAQTSLLAYTIQPAWAHPYPTQFLKEGTFSPDRGGMAWPIIKSGKLATPKTYRTMRFEFGLYYYVNDSFRVGVDYQAELNYSNTRGKEVSFKSNDIFLGATYIH